MRKISAILAAAAVAAPLLMAAAGWPENAAGPMTFWMDASQWRRRDARAVVYSTAASDFEIPVACAYDAARNAYAWTVAAEPGGRYAGEDMVLFGAHGGWLLARRFAPRGGLSQWAQWQEIPAPAVSVAGRQATVTWAAPPQNDMVEKWELIVDGGALDLPAQPFEIALAPGAHSFRLRASASGSPKPHYAYGPQAAAVAR